MQYQKGYINYRFRHEDKLEIAPVPGDTSQPFTVTDAEGNINYVTAVEPTGDSSGIYQVWVSDGRTGEIYRYNANDGEPLTGPEAATGYVMNNIDRQGLEPVEPVPAVVDGTLYWQVKLLPSDGRGITNTAFVNSSDNSVTIVETDSEIRAFIGGEHTVGETPDTGGDDPTSPTPSGTITITVEYADGSTEELLLTEGDTVTIRTGNETATG